MDVDLVTLETAALAASPGPYHACGSKRSTAGDSCVCRVIWSESADTCIALALSSEDGAYTDGEGASPEQARANARFMALAHPQTVLALVEEIRSLRSGTLLRERASFEDWRKRML